MAVVPTGTIEDHHGMGIRGDLAADLAEMVVHRGGIADRQRPLSCRARRRSSAAPGSLRKKYAGIVYPPNMVRLPNHSTTSGNPRKPVLVAARLAFVLRG